MIIADTSVWIAHFRKSDKRLSSLLEESEISCHPFIIGELACGGLGNRKEILSLLQALPTYSPISTTEFFHFLDSYRLYGKGIGFVDVHLLASAFLNSDFVWTLDKKLDLIARRFKIAFV
ncbi:VapC toxin family PIN domain ribonuclease [bacterium]|nr:VapC toxin family PIN domain ribonuclease [candidate division CSSED10-310 bacterium]